jgi:hypothetical protein
MVKVAPAEAPLPRIINTARARAAIGVAREIIGPVVRRRGPPQGAGADILHTNKIGGLRLMMFGQRLFLSRQGMHLLAWDWPFHSTLSAGGRTDLYEINIKPLDDKSGGFFVWKIKA